MNKPAVRTRIFIFFLSLAAFASLGRAQSSVKLIKSVDLVGYTGDFDHFAVDYDRNRLLIKDCRAASSILSMIYDGNKYVG